MIYHYLLQIGWGVAAAINCTIAAMDQAFSTTVPGMGIEGIREPATPVTTPVVPPVPNPSGSTTTNTPTTNVNTVPSNNAPVGIVGAPNPVSNSIGKSS